MFGLFVALGPINRVLDRKHILAIWPGNPKSEILTVQPDVFIVRFTPKDSVISPEFIWSEDGKLFVCVDGFLITDRAGKDADLGENLHVFANTCRQEGYSSGLRSIISGTYNLIVADLDASMCYLSTDHAGTLPLYYSRLENGWIFSSNPVVLALTGLVNTDLDLVACSELAYNGYTIGDRFMMQGIKVFPAYTSFKWSGSTGQGQAEENADSPCDILPSDPPPSVDQLADSFIEGCRRISKIYRHPAHFQSSGKDSRLILASWPEEYDLPCYTYGDPESLEVHIARLIAELRGSKWTHVWLDGDEVAQNLYNLFTASGMIIWPDRYFAARQMLSDGYTATTDGYYGGIMIHAGAYDCDRYFSLLSRLGRFATLFFDQKISAIGLDRISETLSEYILEVKGEGQLPEFVSDDFVEELKKQKPCVLQDIHNEISRLMPENDSLAVLWRKFIAANRGPHNHVQQGVMCRSFVNVCYPFCADLDHHRLQLQVKPGTSTYDRQYIELYRRRFPKYADLPYGATLLPLRTSAFRQKLCRVILSKGWNIPYLTGKTYGRERDANSWGTWLRKSRRLRDMAAEFLREGGIIDEKNCAATFEFIASGTKKASGKLFHLASIAKWKSLSNQVSS